ncbi:MAG: hypothetical protein O9331_14120, partial [Acidovorax sp.]|nr:hypothetical protein [Acidovorax sp.]
MSTTKKIPFPKNLLAIAASALLTPVSGWTLTLVQEPPLPTSKSAFVAPNVIISVDDSGSMKFGVKTASNGSTSTGKGYTEPDDSGNWKDNAQRINVLKYALKQVFNDTTLIPENKIRISWQTMHNNGGS